ncbi:hypothetical protein AKJ60_01240 [candidate division MSBL1 archaeon SCGC-AAA385M11]|nr:hypothetical protein AKJ60_01240 [candidate division MSBL1 archaeon SCGC-AAA385M11]
MTPFQSLQDISKYIQDNKHSFLSDVLGKVIQTKYADYLEQERAVCPCCGQEVPKQGDLTRKIDTLHGTTEICRPYFYCRALQDHESYKRHMFPDATSKFEAIWKVYKEWHRYEK